jgi:hypothetical protein
MQTCDATPSSARRSPRPNSARTVWCVLLRKLRDAFGFDFPENTFGLDLSEDFRQAMDTYDTAPGVKPEQS